MSQTLDHARVRASSARRVFGRVSLATVTASGHRAGRLVSVARAEDDDEVRLLYTRSGTVGVTQDDRSTLASDRALIILRSGSTYSYSTLGNVDVVIVSVPRDALSPRAARALTRITARSLPQNPLTASLIASIDSVQSSVRTSLPAETDALEDFLTRLVVAVVDDTVESLRLSSEPERTLRLRVLADIEANADRPEFCPEDVATLIGVSPRRLHRLFALEPLSVSQRILDTRLERVVAELTAPNNASTLTTIAQRHGFRGLDQCARAFKRRFGETMRDYRLASLL